MSDRPDPDALLREVHAEATRAARAKLKIFFGFAPGVGKTYAMLEAAQRLASAGVDVVVGYVETHGRPETSEKAKGLETIPRARIPHGGAYREELDLEGVLARRPAVVLVDELAHTNAPGARHTKRYQDVLDLLDAGIEVHTTLNVQHVESVNDVVAQITGVRVRETVPDSVLDRADEMALVDIPEEALLARLREGKIYLGERADRALEGFFQRGNLLALRELALRLTAAHVDADVLAYRTVKSITGTWAAGERILVCVSPAPASARLIRAARRMAEGLHAPFLAAYVQPSDASPMSSEDAERLESHLRLAESLGGEVVRLGGRTVSEAILEHARKRNVTRILLGKPTHSRLRDRLRGSLLDDVVRGSHEIDVLVIAGDASPARVEGHAPSSPPDRAPYAYAAALVVVATLLSWLCRALFAMPDVVMIYLLVVIVVAVRFGRRPSFFATALSIAAFDFFFVPPFFTFAVSDGRHVFTFAMMFGVATLISALTLRIKRQEENARAREAQTATLYALSRELGSAFDDRAAAEVLARHAADVFESGTAVLAAKTGAIETLARVGILPTDLTEQGVVRWVLEHGRPAGKGTDTLPGAGITCVPVRVGERVLAVLALASVRSGPLRPDERELLDVFVRQGALALERARLADTAKAAALKARTEEMRSSLLSAVSHDLRTPLATITGAVTTLRDTSATLSPPQRADLEDVIQEEAERLERLVANLLEMTRLETGGVVLRREWVPLDEVVSAALSRLEARLADRTVTVALTGAPPLVSVDPMLLEQVFLNLVENAAKYSPPSTPIDIAATHGAQTLEITVADRGPGIPEADAARVFEKFFRGAHVGIGGVGLGLPICRAVMQAHDGSIRVEARPAGGAIFRLTLPLLGASPEVVAEPSEDAP